MGTSWMSSPCLASGICHHLQGTSFQWKGMIAVVMSFHMQFEKIGHGLLRKALQGRREWAVGWKRKWEKAELFPPVLAANSPISLSLKSLLQ